MSNPQLSNIRYDVSEVLAPQFATLRHATKNIPLEDVETWVEHSRRQLRAIEIEENNTQSRIDTVLRNISTMKEHTTFVTHSHDGARLSILNDKTTYQNAYSQLRVHVKERLRTLQSLCGCDMFSQMCSEVLGEGIPISVPPSGSQRPPSTLVNTCKQYLVDDEHVHEWTFETICELIRAGHDRARKSKKLKTNGRKEMVPRKPPTRSLRTNCNEQNSPPQREVESQFELMLFVNYHLGSHIVTDSIPKILSRLISECNSIDIGLCNWSTANNTINLADDFQHLPTKPARDPDIGYMISLMKYSNLFADEKMFVEQHLPWLLVNIRKLLEKASQMVQNFLLQYIERVIVEVKPGGLGLCSLFLIAIYTYKQTKSLSRMSPTNTLTEALIRGDYGDPVSYSPLVCVFAAYFFSRCQQHPFHEHDRISRLALELQGIDVTNTLSLLRLSCVTKFLENHKCHVLYSSQTKYRILVLRDTEVQEIIWLSDGSTTTMYGEGIRIRMKPEEKENTLSIMYRPIGWDTDFWFQANREAQLYLQAFHKREIKRLYKDVKRDGVS